MERSRLTLLAGAAGLLILLICAFIAAGAAGFLRGRGQSTPRPVETVTRCDDDPAGLCVVSFGVDTFNRMVINFRLPEADYPEFYVLAGGERYECQRVEGTPRSVFCSGPRAPLGAALELRVHALGGGALLAQGSLRLTALALPTSMNLGTLEGVITPEPVETTTPFIQPLPADTATRTPTGTATITRTPTATGTLPTVTPSITGTPPTVTPSITGTPPTVTPSVTATLTPTFTTTPPSITPSRTPFDPRQ